MTAYLVLAARHGLLPVAQRLRREGHNVQWAPWRARYDRAWEGSLEAALKGESRRDEETLRPVIEMAKAGEVRVLLDHGKWAELFAGAQDVWGTAGDAGEVPQPLRACGWWDGERLLAPHLLVVDLGAWPGGLGARVEGGATLVRGYGEWVSGLWDPYRDELKGSGHRGLVQLHLDRGLRARWWEGGWKALHLHAWLAALEQPLGGVLDGAMPVLEPAYSVVVPVTVPPWPVASNKTSAPSPVEAPREVVGRASWHDTRLVGEQLVVAELDGFVAVAKGSAQGLGLARRRALEVATAIGVPEKQLRPDVGAMVELVQAGLEGMGHLP